MGSSYPVLSVADVRQLPPMRWLVKGVIPQQSFSVLYAPPAHGKSFVALDLAHSVGQGADWLGHPTTTGNVMYVVAGEGQYGLRQRVEAWEQYNLTTVTGVSYGLEAVQLGNVDSVKTFLRGVRPLLPLSLVVFDTLARCASGLDENSVEDMGPVISGCDHIREQTGAAVMLLHHTSKPDKDGRVSYRGSSALEGAPDTMLELTRDGSKSRLVLSCHKQKDAREFFPIRLKLETVYLPGGESAVPVLR